eukprot:COSAG01_NODE_11209_length_1981_cov_4.317216_2_plen_106_part_00
MPVRAGCAGRPLELGFELPASPAQPPQPQGEAGAEQEGAAAAAAEGATEMARAEEGNGADGGAGLADNVLRLEGEELRTWHAHNVSGEALGCGFVIMMLGRPHLD